MGKQFPPGFVAKKGQKINNRRADAPGGRKCTQEEVERRVDFVCDLLCRKQTKSEIHTAMRDRYCLSYNTVDKIYIPRAHKRLKELFQMTTAEAKQYALERLHEILRSGTAAECLRGLEIFADIYGYNAPKTMEHVGGAGGPIQHQFTVQLTQEELP